MAVLIRSVLKWATTVWMARRSLGGVSITDMSRMPSSDMCSVRGIGVALMVSTSMLCFICFSRSLCLHAEALLLIDDQQAKVVELTSFESSRCVPIEDVHLAGRGVGQHFFDFLGVRKRLSMSIAHGKRGKSALERLEVLKCEHGGRSEHRDLFAVAQRLECGAHGHFRLAEADVAAEQAVHGLLAFHVRLDLRARR